MNLMSHLTQRQLGLDPPLTRDLIVARDLPVPMQDGTILLADRYAPRADGDGLPVALMRSPYGRGALLAAGMVRPLAERGFQVILQSARGTFGSGGSFEPMRNEREDGLATLDWIVKQPWFGGSIVLVGPSYLGYVQWAVADRLPPEVKAMIPQVTESALTLEFLRSDAFSLETPFGWGVMIDGQERGGAMLRQLLQARKNQRAMRALPLGQADVAAIGHHTQYLQDILAHDADDPYWAAIDHRDRVAEVAVPVSSIGGWYDIFLPGQLRDFMTPADPTPAAGGVRMIFGRNTGRVDNTTLEARPDVLTYTTPPLASDVEVIGEVGARIWFRSSLPHADVFVRLCDVDRSGKSWNICDGLTSVSGADELASVAVKLWPTAYRFKAGHRIRVQVSSGAFPRYARNPGTGEARATAARLLSADQSVYHDPEHLSAITLPVRGLPDASRRPVRVEGATGAWARRWETPSRQAGGSPPAAPSPDRRRPAPPRRPCRSARRGWRGCRRTSGRARDGCRRRLDERRARPGAGRR
jgi:predicted acyl esterase